MSVLPSMYVCVPELTEARKGVGSLELELHLVVSHHMDSEKRTLVLWKNIKCP